MENWELEVDERTVAWLDENAAHISAVIMRTERDEDGVDYEVLVVDDRIAGYEQGDNERGIWSRRVDFGHTPQLRAGGAAFVAAARDQQDCAAVMWTRKTSAVAS